MFDMYININIYLYQNNTAHEYHDKVQYLRFNGLICQAA